MPRTDTLYIAVTDHGHGHASRRAPLPEEDGCAQWAGHFLFSLVEKER